jgi:hypothetical protein
MFDTSLMKIERKTLSSVSDTGDRKYTLTEIANNIPCNIQPDYNKLKDVSAGNTNTEYMIVFTSYQGIQNADIITNLANNKKYEVNGERYKSMFDRFQIEVQSI